MKPGIIVLSLITLGSALSSKVERQLQSLHIRDADDNSIEDEPWTKTKLPYQHLRLKLRWKWGTLAHDSLACRKNPQRDACGTDLYCKGFGQNGQFLSQRTPRFRSREQCLQAHESPPAKLPWVDGTRRPDSAPCRRNPVEQQCGSYAYCASYNDVSGHARSRVAKYKTSEECFNAREKNPQAKSIQPKRRWEDGTSAGRELCGISAFTAEACGTMRYCQLFPTTRSGVHDEFANTAECMAAFKPRDFQPALDSKTQTFLQCIMSKHKSKHCGTQIYCDMVGAGEVQDAKWKTKEECLRGHPGLV
ncbi:hypothetical protein JDV02_009650 [Purpureocillium takamizusanense]|uniref:Uncharacterized protein n=1 Tax=Purpureocillium takamizusanense TaxID=2060973 RepID=A0A9Q8QSV9_9HYPO|nr:uncharacterized protein JDV02_009650 [Purpureocillium takamizusanense]UNI23857.1 hypothetical protein JDV02_009650 [Purpureocillium takamizusanense]